MMTVIIKVPAEESEEIKRQKTRKNLVISKEKCARLQLAEKRVGRAMQEQDGQGKIRSSAYTIITNRDKLARHPSDAHRHLKFGDFW